MNLNETYSPPPVAGVPNPSTSYAYDPDHLLKQVTRPDGGIVDLTYHVTNAQLERVEFPSAGSTTPRWRVDYSYGNGPASAGTPKGLLQKADRVGMAAVEYRYDGSLPTQEQWTGRVQGTVARTYDAFFRPATDVVSVGGASRAVGYGYDDDGLLMSINASDGSWSLLRDSWPQGVRAKRS